MKSYLIKFASFRSLTEKEVMRICRPETELERRLFEIVNDIQSELDNAEDERDSAIRMLEEDSISMDDYRDLVKEINRAIGAIASGKPDDARGILESAI